MCIGLVPVNELFYPRAFAPVKAHVMTLNLRRALCICVLLLLSPLAEPQGEADEAPRQTSLPRSAPSFTEQLRGGGLRLPLAARETLESRS